MRKFVRPIELSRRSALWVVALALGAILWFALQIPTEPPKVFLNLFEGLELPEIAPPRLLHQYIEVVDSCGPHYEGEEGCVRTRAGPGVEYPVVARLRTGVVLKVDRAVVRDMRIWYRVVFEEPIRYPERLPRVQFVAGDFVRHFYGDGVQILRRGERGPLSKHILIDRSKQMLYAYEGENMFMLTSISTGHELTPTPRGTFTIYKKTPSRYMQGPLPGISDDEYDLPGVPWDLYFTEHGGAIHGAYWHNNFGKPWSHGCVNLPLQEARKLYEWADIGTRVIVRN